MIAKLIHPQNGKKICLGAWQRSINVWAGVKVKPKRKTQLLIEISKKDTKIKGLKDMVTSLA